MQIYNTVDVLKIIMQSKNTPGISQTDRVEVSKITI